MTTSPALAARYPIAHVVWIDSSHGVSRWEDREEALARIFEHWADPIHSAGFLIVDGFEHIVVCANDNEGLDDISQCVVIPRFAIRSLDIWAGHAEPET